MKISPKYECSDWKNLDLTPQFSEKWKKGADIVCDRIRGRYLAQIEVLEEHLDEDIWLYSGFLIMAVDCMVIETMNQFYLGISNTNVQYHRKNWESFRDFFARSRFFRKEFDDKKACIFYDHVRNGLLHQAQTKEKTLINIERSSMIEPVNPSALDDGIIVNRKLFHEALVKEFNEYIINLKTDDIRFNSLRKSCMDKMKTIC